MAGTYIMIAILVISPVPILMGMTALAAALGWSLNDEVDSKHEGSELLDIAYPNKPED